MAKSRPRLLAWDGVSSLGVDWATSWQRAVAGQSGIGPLTRFPLRPDFPVRVAGQVDLDPAAIEPLPPCLRPREMAHWKSPVFRYSMLVAHRALAKAGIVITPALAPRVAVTFSTAIGGIDAVVDADRALVGTGALPLPYMNPNSCVNMIAGKIAMLSGATGPCITTVTACATGSTAMAMGALLMDAGRADVVIAGAVDFPLVEPIVAGFATMNGAFKHKTADDETQPQRASRPFSLDRRGFVISEGAGCVIMVSAEFAAAHGLRADFELAGWSLTSDAHHPVAPHRPTVARCIAEAIADAELRPEAIAAVNAHASSTKVGDKIEDEALHDVFGEKVPPVSANKSQFGHAMGAASVIESMLALEGMRAGALLPTLNFTPDPEIRLDVVTATRPHANQEYVLKNAFGFGGTNTCLVFRRLA
ncbi:MAG: beta-ketoacyl-[acyl-carrier-protein] synthase family protein [Deltaproteobacteria bacterium]|nr:beta-ketoacyl-[acyl-carrier-protein] synthase family protein [Deltaproteobacteria bacterium]